MDSTRHWEFSLTVLTRQVVPQQVNMATDSLESKVKELVIANENETDVKSTKDTLEVTVDPTKEVTEVVDKKKEVGVLGEKDSNTPTAEVVCAHCKKTKPTKRCAKRHPKCLQKLFCNETCEVLAHKKKEDPNAAPKPDAKKVDAKKKKDKKKENSKHGKHVRFLVILVEFLLICFRLRQSNNLLQRLRIG